MSLKSLKFEYSHQSSDPLEVTYKLKNPNKVDLYFCTYFQAWDRMGRGGWKITNEKDEKAGYMGIMAERVCAEDNPNAWKLIKKNSEVRETRKLPFELPEGKKYDVEYTKTTIRVCKSKGKKKMKGVKEIGLDVVSCREGDGALEKGKF